jgi:hypothetical protein
MILNSHKKNSTEYIVIDDLYSEHELSLIKEELISLIPHLKTVEEIKSAYHKDHKDGVKAYKKNCLSLWADDHYAEDRAKSSILTFNRKLFSESITSFSENVNSFYGHIKCCNSDRTLLNFYQNNEHYESHKDLSMISTITFIELGSVKGGGLIFTKENIKVEFKDNRMIIFAGCISHKTESIITAPNNYRVSVAQFIKYIE